jgi:peptide-methionine (S)-S-oxide reductase
MQQAKTELAPKSPPAGQDIATFAGGCFWGLELAFQREPGVTHTSVGYTQGDVEAPSYQAVCGGSTGHSEAVQVYFDPKETNFERLLELFFERTDPTTKNRQGNDSGSQYRSQICYHSDEQKAAAEKMIADINAKLKDGSWRPVAGKEVVVELVPAGDYWLAEDYHQQYLEKGGQDASKGASSRIRCYG